MKTNQIITILLIIALLGFGYYMFANQATEEMPNEATDQAETETQDTEDTQDDTELAEGEELPEDLRVYEGWETVEADGYYFMHPGYFIEDRGDHYIMAYEPVEGQEFSAIVIYKPVAMDDPMAVMQQHIAGKEGLGVEVVTEPEEVSIEGTTQAYHTSYEIQSGPTTGLNHYYLLQSPSIEEWVSIEYADNETAENIRESFNFID